MHGKGKEETSDSYLETLEEVQKQYQQYVEVSGLYELSASKEEEEIEYAPPDFKNPLTTNTLRIK